MNEFEKRLLESVPKQAKECIAAYQTHELVGARTGLTDFSVEKVAQYLGGMAAARRKKWLPVADGLVSLAKLAQGEK